MDSNIQKFYSQMDSFLKLLDPFFKKISSLNVLIKKNKLIKHIDQRTKIAIMSKYCSPYLFILIVIILFSSKKANKLLYVIIIKQINPIMKPGAI